MFFVECVQSVAMTALTCEIGLLVGKHSVGMCVVLVGIAALSLLQLLMVCG